MYLTIQFVSCVFKFIGNAMIRRWNRGMLYSIIVGHILIGLTEQTICQCPVSGITRVHSMARGYYLIIIIIDDFMCVRSYVVRAHGTCTHSFHQIPKSRTSFS